MWRITHLLLKNITYLYSGLGKYEIDIDFTDANLNSKLNLIIGPMGSGKSVILGHLQPFASFGTLDVRNSDDMILPEVDGLKVIEFDHDQTHYIVTHRYLWNKTTSSHNIRSYITKDGVELNENGNSSSFKEIIKLYFGIEQNFLRVLRLGPNVANVINMKSTERKSFVASLMQDTEIYLMLYKKLSDDYRTINASINAISNRLIQLSATKEKDMRESLSRLQDDYISTGKEIDELTSEKNQLIGEINSLSNNQTRHELDREYKRLANELDELKLEKEKLEDTIRQIDSTVTLETISNNIGQLQGRLNYINEQKMLLENEYSESIKLVTRLKDKLLVQGNVVQLDEMKKIFMEVSERYKRYTIELSGFKCKYTYHYLSSFIDNLHEFRRELDECSQYDGVDIQRVYHKLNQSITTTVKEKIDILTGKRVNLQKRIGNLEYSATYSSMYPLFRSPMCPSEDCPYYQTHPITLKHLSGNKVEVNNQVHGLKDEIDKLDIEISKWQEYPIIQKNILFLSNQWKSIYPVLVELKMIDPGLSLLSLLTDFRTRNHWVSFSLLTDILEKCQMQLDFDEVSLKYKELKNEIDKLESSEGKILEDSYHKAVLVSEDLITKMNTYEYDKNKITDEINIQESEYLKIQNKETMRTQLDQLLDSITSMDKSLRDLGEAIYKIDENTRRITTLDKSIDSVRVEYSGLGNQIDRMKMVLSQIEYNQNEYKSLIDDREILKALVDATSSKEGIPLILVKRFLNSCTEIINDLIADVFEEDDLEILEFDISDTEFKIPYLKNGKRIDDIEYASQGQQSIISIALSFALVQQSMFDYNIMLLDEIDGPLYKKDREKFISILSRQMQEIHADQVFLITHNNNFEGNPINVIMTTEEVLDNTSQQVILRLT